MTVDDFLRMKPDLEQLENVCNELKYDPTLNILQVVRVFGWPAVELFLLVSTGSTNDTIIPLLIQIRDLLKEKKECSQNTSSSTTAAT